MKRRIPLSLLFSLLVALQASCASTPEKGGGEATPVEASPVESAPAPARGPFSNAPTTRQLTLLHTSDNESDLLGSERDDDDAAPHGGIARALSLTRALEKRAREPVLVVGAGDTWMPAPELHLEIDGKSAAVESNNLLGYRASALGNHEWDLGESFLAEQLAHARFPYLSATLNVTEGPLAKHTLPAEAFAGTTPWAEESAGKLLPRALACAGVLAPVGEEGASARSRCQGHVVGLVGATTETLRAISNVPAHVELAADLDEVRTRIQAQVDALRDEGVDIIVLLSHLQGVAKELLLVEEGLVGVDIIVAGGGDDRLANARHRLLPGDAPHGICAASPEECYPLVRTAKDGRPVLVVATDGQLRYVGALSVGFDEHGVLTDVATGSRPWPVDEESLLELRAELVPEAVAFETRVHEELAPRARPFANLAHFLEGRRELVRNRQTNLGDLSADAMQWAAKETAPEGWAPALALRNGGGIRAPIGHFALDHEMTSAAEGEAESFTLKGGPLRPIDVESALRFDNKLVVLRSTHAALKETLEAALRGAGTSRGHFPQVSREVLLEYTRAAPELKPRIVDGRVVGVACEGARVRTLRLKGEDGSVVSVVEEGRLLTPDAKVDIVTLSFLAKGGDGWFPGRAGALETALLEGDDGPVTEQRSFRAFVEHLVREGTWDDGRAWPDPVTGQAETFTRIREVDEAVPAADSCEG